VASTNDACAFENTGVGLPRAKKTIGVFSEDMRGAVMSFSVLGFDSTVFLSGIAAGR
jgi:hypothetical protein